MSSLISLGWSRLRNLELIVLIWLHLTIFTVSASSPPVRPLEYISQPVIHALEILPRSVQPRPLASRSELSNLSSLQHTDSFRLVLSAFGETHYLHLRPNLDLLHRSSRIKYYKNGPNGSTIITRIEPLFPHNIRAYFGEVVHPDSSAIRLAEDRLGGVLHSQAETLGWARIVIHSSGDPGMGLEPVIEGAYTVNGVTHHIMPKDKYLRVKHPMDPATSFESRYQSVIFRDSNITPEYRNQSVASACSHDNLNWNTNPLINPSLRHRPSKSSLWTDFGLYRRDDVAGGQTDNNFEDTIGQSNGCPSEQRIVYMGVAADCQYVQQHGSQQNATTAILTNWNTATALYKQTFNISLGILEIQVQEPTCPSQPNSSIPWNVDCNSLTLNDRLSLFSQWRGEQGADGAGLWHLMSGCPTGTEVGVAWLGTLCMTTASNQGSEGTVSGTGVTTVSRSEWQVIAHEIGHNFGAIHDCASGCDNSHPTCCPLSTTQCDANSGFIMNPTSSSSEQRFSQCTLGNICSLMLSGTTNTSCVQPPDPSKQTLSLQMCGNGILEAGEECDPGVGMNSTCCDSSTCKLRSGAQCDPDSTTCCTADCQFAPSTQVCRPSKDALCDTPETCTGNSANCPPDQRHPDGQKCGNNGLACASGQCTSLTQQCQTVGRTMDLTNACPAKGDTSCQLACQSPNQSNECIVLQAQLIDGSQCGYGGKCYGGQCKSGSPLDTFRAWYRANLQIAIPVTIGVAVIILLILSAILRCICRYRKSRRARSSEPALSSTRAQRLANGLPSQRRSSQMMEAPQSARVLPRSERRRSTTRSTRARSADAQLLTSQLNGHPEMGTAVWPTDFSGAQFSRPGRSRSVHWTADTNHMPSDWVDPTTWNGPVRY